MTENLREAALEYHRVYARSSQGYGSAKATDAAANNERIIV